MKILLSIILSTLYIISFSQSAKSYIDDDILKENAKIVKELITISSILQPIADSVLTHSIELFRQDAKIFNVNLPTKEIEIYLASFTKDTLATSESSGNYSLICFDLGYFISFIDEPGRLLTVLYHEFGHIYLGKKDTKIGETIMNYNYITIDLLNDPKRGMYLRNLFVTYK